MWKLWHRLFGWDYVLVCAFGTWNRRKIKKLPNGREYVRPWTHLKDTTFLDSPEACYPVIHLTRLGNEH